MMKRKNLVKSLTLSACALALTALPASALEKEDYDLLTTMDLYSLCSVAADHGDYATARYACRSFMKGAVQYHDGVSTHDKLPRLVCYPKGTTIEEGRVAFVAWAKSKTGDEVLMGELPVYGVVRALSEKYPCK